MVHGLIGFSIPTKRIREHEVESDENGPKQMGCSGASGMERKCLKEIKGSITLNGIRVCDYDHLIASDPPGILDQFSP